MGEGDRVFPAAKPTANAAVAAENGEANPPTPAKRPTVATRPPFRPQPPPKRRHSRGCCCSCCLWTTLSVLLLLLLVALAGGVFYAIYRPHSPSFGLNYLHFTKFNLTGGSLTTSFDFSMSARNPNKKITLFYDTVAVKVLSGDLDIADGSLPGFFQDKENSTTFKSVASRTDKKFPDGTDISSLKSSFASKSKNLALKIQLDTRVKFKIGAIKTKNFKIRVNCDGIQISIPTGRTATLAATRKVRCKVSPRIKIFKWNV